MFTWKTHYGLKFHSGQFDRSEICTKVSFFPPEVMWTLIMKLPHTGVKLYPEVKSQTGLSSLRVSRPSLSSRLLYDPRWQYIANQSGSAKDTVSLKIGENIEILILYVWGHKTGFWFISIIIIKLRWINIKIGHKNWI